MPVLFPFVLATWQYRCNQRIGDGLFLQTAFNSGAEHPARTCTPSTRFHFAPRQSTTLPTILACERLDPGMMAWAGCTSNNIQCLYMMWCQCVVWFLLLSNSCCCFVVWGVGQQWKHGSKFPSCKGREAEIGKMGTLRVGKNFWCRKETPFTKIPRGYMPTLH